MASAESQVVTVCQPPSTKESNHLLHILAKRNWKEYGAHMWETYEPLVRESVQIAATFPKEVGIDRRNNHGMTPLMSAVGSGNEVMAFELVKAKCDINARHRVEGEAERTAMDMAACAKRGDIIEHLKAHGGRGLCTAMRGGHGYQQKRPRTNRS